MPEYKQRDIEEQDDVYIKHISAMTGESLHSKSDIAAELAHRDIRIEVLQNALIEAAEGYAIFNTDLYNKLLELANGEENE